MDYPSKLLTHNVGSYAPTLRHLVNRDDVGVKAWLHPKCHNGDTIAVAGARRQTRSVAIVTGDEGCAARIKA